MDADMMRQQQDEEPVIVASYGDFRIVASEPVEPFLILPADDISILGEAGALRAAIQRKYGIDVGEQFANDFYHYLTARY